MSLIEQLWKMMTFNENLLDHLNINRFFNLNFDNDFIVNILIILIGVIISWIIWWFLFVPMDWTKDLSDVGYNHLADVWHKKYSKRDTINRLKRLRKVGDKLPPPFPNGWFGVIESKNLLPGKAVSVDCLGQNLVVFRSEEGKPFIMDAYCPHLGANLGVGGLVRGDCIECPFHLWKFRGDDGECVNIPYSKNASVPKNAKLKTWKCSEVNGSIFVWHHKENEEPWTIPVVKEVDTGEWMYYGRNEFLVSCHIQDIAENGADVAHLSAVHGPSMIAGSDLRTSRTPWASFGTHSWDAVWKGPIEQPNTHISTIALTHSIRLFNKLELCDLNVTANQIGPGYVQLKLSSMFGNMIILQTVTPIDSLLQKVIHTFYGPKSLSWFGKFLITGESIMFERDMMVWNHKEFFDSPCLVKEDRLIKSYRTWYSQFYTQNSLSFAQSKENLEW